MNNFEEKNVEQLDVESLIVDLLASGLGATIILFFIFSVRILTSTSAATSNTNIGKTIDNSGNGLVSLVGDNNSGKPIRMVAIRIVELRSLEKSTVELLKSKWKSNPSEFWDYDKKRFNKDSLIKTIEMQLMIKDNNLSFIFIADAITSELTFQTPEIPELKEQKANLRIHFLEGQSIKYDFNGYMRWPYNNPVGYSLSNLSNRKIEILTGKARENSLYKLVKFIN